MEPKNLKASDIERLENTSVLTTLFDAKYDECCCSISSHDNCCKEAASFLVGVQLP